MVYQQQKEIPSKKGDVPIMKRRATIKINGKMTDVEIENGEITIIEQKEKMATGWELTYTNYVVDTTGKVFDGLPPMNQARYNNANCFASKELAENISRMQTLQRRMFRWQARNDSFIDTNDGNMPKWRIVYDVADGTITPEMFYCLHSGFLPYFSSKETAKDCIEDYKDELTWLFTEFKWRMDGKDIE